MAIATKTSTQSITDSFIDNSLKSAKSSLSSKSATELYKSDDKRNVSKSEDFKRVLNSKTNSKDNESTRKVDDDVKDNEALTRNNQAADTDEVKDADNIDTDKIKEKLDELEEESKTDSKDKASDILSELLALLTKLGVKEEDIKVDGKINFDALKSILNGTNGDKSSSNALNNIMEKIMELLKNDTVKSKLDINSLKAMEKILGNLVNDNTDATKDIKSSLKNLMSEVSKLINNNGDQTNKVLSLKDMLNKNYSQNNSENSTGKENNNSTTSNDNSELSKEDKFLNSLIDDDKDSSTNKINLFASRNAAIQNQGVNTTVRGLTINKATFVDDFIKDVKYMSNNSLKELTVKLNPGNLGEMTIKLVQEDGIMKANIKASSKETTALLSQNLAEIKKQLSDQNIKVSEVNIELYQDDTTFFKGEGSEGQFAGEQNKQNNNSQRVAVTAEGAVSEELDENIAKENSEINMFA